MTTFTTVGLIGRYADPKAGEPLHALGRYLIQRGLKVLLDESTAHQLTSNSMDVASREEIGTRCDLVIVMGGDGTLLNAARTLADFHIPLVGVNMGRLGFLTDISPNDLECRLGEILKGNYTQEERCLLQCTIERDGEIINASDAFNDVVVHKWEGARMIEVDTFVDGHFVNTVHSDGLIVSTPTGSTAYALSGGGPLMMPTLNAMVLVPICPHTLSNRPIVIGGDSVVEIIVSENARSAAQATCDGQINLGLIPGDRITIRKKERPVRLIHPLDHDHFHILRAKLGWG